MFTNSFLEKLKPCPFCGSKGYKIEQELAETDYHDKASVKEYSFKIDCNVCGLSYKTISMPFEVDALDQFLEEWNMRTTVTSKIVKASLGGEE